jgi:hypothetical protein
MKKVSRPVLTIAAIFGSAFLLAAMGCGSSKSTKVAPEGPKGTIQDTGSGADTKPPVVVIPQEIPATKITRECNDTEFSKLVAWRKLLDSANTAVDTVKNKKDPQAIQAAVEAVKACDAVMEHHKAEPCRKTKKTVVATEVKLYDEGRLYKDCKKATGYLVAHNALPDKNTNPVVTEPTAPNNPPVVTIPTAPTEPQTPPVVITPDQGTQTGPFRQCSTDEFSKLSDYSNQQTKADTAIKSLGPVSSWTYNANAISTAALTVKSVEALIKYHSANPCQKVVTQTDGSKVTKEYTGSTLRARSQVARTYFYEFVQNTKTLIFPNADLYLDFSPLNHKVFPAGFRDQVSGNCLVENRTDSDIDYSNRQALIKDTRGFSEKMLVMETAEGLLVQCYGLNIDGPFSKRQIVKVLKEEDSDIRLTYKLK